MSWAQLSKCHLYTFRWQMQRIQNDNVRKKSFDKKTSWQINIAQWFKLEVVASSSPCACVGSLWVRGEPGTSWGNLGTLYYLFGTTVSVHTCLSLNVSHVTNWWPYHGVPCFCFERSDQEDQRGRLLYFKHHLFVPYVYYVLHHRPKKTSKQAS